MTESYGYELILDLHNCDVSTFNRKSLDGYFEKLCKAIRMQKCERHFWDDFGVPKKDRQTSPHTKGTTAVHRAAKPLIATQFILTSNITIHALGILKAAYVNIFSCKRFDPKVAERITTEWFGAGICHIHFITRV